MLELRRVKGVEVVFEIESPTSRELVTTHHNQQQPILPYLQELDLWDMDSISHVWKCSNWNKFFTLPKQQSESPFHSLTTIHIWNCESIKYLFSPLMAKLLSNLKKVHIDFCHGIEEVVSNRDDEDEEMTTSTHTTTILFPHLDSLSLISLKNLKCIGGGGAKGGSDETSFNNTTTTTDQFEFSEAGGVSWSLCQYSREIRVVECHALSSVIPCYAAGQMQKLQVLRIEYCDGMKEVFETQLGTSRNNKSGCDEGIPRVNNNFIMLPNLKILEIRHCGGLEHIFPFSAHGSLRQLEELTIWNCKAMKVILKEEEDASSSSSSSKEVVVFPRLKSIELNYLPELEGFFLGKNEFQWPSLDTLIIKNCPKMMVFAAGLGTSRNNKSGCDEGIPRVNNNLIMLPNLKILEIICCPLLEHIFPFSAHGSLRQLEELTIYGCESMKVILKKEEEDESSSSSSKEVVVFPRLKSIELRDLPELEGFFLGMNEFQWPSLDKLIIMNCPKMMVFAAGGSTAPQLKYMHTGLGKHTLGECGLNFHAAHHQTPFPSSHGATSCPATSEGTIWSFHNLIKLKVELNNDVEKIIPSSELLQLQKLEKIHVDWCRKVEEVFETALEAAGRNSSSEQGRGFDESSQNTTLVNLPNLREMKLQSVWSLRYIWKSNQWTVFEFPNLTRVEIMNCERLEHVFTSSMAGSLLQLQELYIYNCKSMEEVIVKDADVVEEDKEKESDGKTNEILVFPRLKSLKLKYLPRLKGFCLGKEDFSFPLLDSLIIYKCPAITTFTKGNSATPQLKEIEINDESFYAGEDINSIIKIKQEEFKQDSD